LKNRLTGGFQYEFMMILGSGLLFGPRCIHNSPFKW